MQCVPISTISTCRIAHTHSCSLHLVPFLLRVMKHIFCAIRILNELCTCKFSTATNGIECGVLSAIPNGVITFSPDSTPDYDLYTTATYSCNQNYTLSGNGLLTCINAFGSGTWDSFEPSCMGKQCTCNIVGIWSGSEPPCLGKQCTCNIVGIN